MRPPVAVSRTVRTFGKFYAAAALLDDGHRLEPSFTMVGDDSVPCRWWHHDLAPFCARCGSGRMDLHDGVWLYQQREGSPWTVPERIRLGLPVDEEWWHQAAGLLE